MPTMFVMARVSVHNRVRRVFFTLPWITALTTPEPGEPRKYYVLPDEEPEPPPKAPIRRGCWGAQPRRGGREVIPLEE